MNTLSDPFAPKSPPKRTKTGPIHQLNTLKASGYLSLFCLAINAVIIGQYVARYSGLTVDICLSDHPEEEKICENFVFELLAVAVAGLLLVLCAGTILQGYSGERMDQIMQYVGAGLVGGFAWGWSFDRDVCVWGLAAGAEQGKDCLRGLRLGILANLVVLVGLLLADQGWFVEEKPKDEGLPGGKMD